MGTKNNPGNYDCYHNAEPDEPMFILLARDPASACLVRMWADMRKMLVLTGAKPVDDLAMLAEAHDCAAAMDKFYHERQKAKRKKEGHEKH